MQYEYLSIPQNAIQVLCNTSKCNTVLMQYLKIQYNSHAILQNAIQFNMQYLKIQFNSTYNIHINATNKYQQTYNSSNSIQTINNTVGIGRKDLKKKMSVQSLWPVIGNMQ